MTCGGVDLVETELSGRTVRAMVLLHEPGRAVTGEMLATAELERADALFRATIDSLAQAVYLYRPCWVDDRIVDLEIVFCNAAALSLPLTERIVPGAFASDVFEQPELAMLEAEHVWRDGPSTPYSIERTGLVDGHPRTIRYEVQTQRVGEHLLQTSTDHTLADDLRRAESRQRLVLDALDDGVTLLAPLFDARDHIISTEVLYANRTAQRMQSSQIGVFTGEFGDCEEVSVAQRAWEADGAITWVLDRLDLPVQSEDRRYAELQAVRVDDHIVQVVRDRTVEMAAFRDKTAADRRFIQTIESLSEAVGIWDAIEVDDKGIPGDFVLRYANQAVASLAVLGTRASSFEATIDLVAAGRTAWNANGESVALSATIAGAETTYSWKFSLVRVNDELVSVGTDISEIASHAAQLEWLTRHQRRTGLLNLEGLVAEVTARATQGRGSYAVIWFKLTQLETIRAMFGFIAADDALATAAERVALVAERCGAIASQPGDSSVALLLPAVASGAQVHTLASSLIQELSAPLESDTMSMLLGPVAGYVIAPLHGSDADLLVRRAKTAAGHASDEQSRVKRWCAEASAAQLKRVTLVGEFGRAMERGEVFMEYQPKVNANTRQLVGAEALVRWMHPTRGRLPPQEFIEGVEASGICRPFTLWAIRSALTEWVPVRERFADTKVAVNVPVPLVSDPNFIEQLAEELVGLGIDPRWLQIEVTERGMHGNINDLQAGLEQLTMLGLSVALDDFGTGQSSLAFVRGLTLDEIKIDRTFVTNLHLDAPNRAIVSACVAIAAHDGMSVCAEGIEAEADLAAAVELGCDYAQGYLLGRPTSIDALLTAWSSPEPPSDR